MPLIRLPRRRALATLIAMFLVTALYLSPWAAPRHSAFFGATSHSGDHEKNLISVCETRTPFIPHNPKEDMNFLTLSTLHNYLYAQAIGAEFRYTIMVDKPDIHDPATNPLGLGEGAYCLHPKHGLRPSNFCRIPLLWNILRDEPDIKNIVHIDSDAIFLSTNRSVQLHFDLLPETHPVGFLNNEPYDRMPCTGYIFLTRGKERWTKIKGPRMNNGLFQALGAQDAIKKMTNVWTAPRSVTVDFLKAWWDRSWEPTKCGESNQLKDQCTLWNMMGVTNIFVDRITNPALAQKAADEIGITFLNEAQFFIADESQMIFHQHHLMSNRYENLKKYWLWNQEYPINDTPEARAKLRELLSKIDYRHLNVTAVAAEWSMVE